MLIEATATTASPVILVQQGFPLQERGLKSDSISNSAKVWYLSLTGWKHGDLTSELFVISKYISLQVLADVHTSVGEIHHLSVLEDGACTHFNQII